MTSQPEANPTADDRRDLLVVFGSVQRVIRVEKAALDGGLDVDSVPAPRAVSSRCGVVLEARSSEASRIRDILTTLAFGPESVYTLRNGSWTPSSLEAATLASVT